MSALIELEMSASLFGEVDGHGADRDESTGTGRFESDVEGGGGKSDAGRGGATDPANGLVISM